MNIETSIYYLSQDWDRHLETNRPNIHNICCVYSLFPKDVLSRCVKLCLKVQVCLRGIDKHWHPLALDSCFRQDYSLHRQKKLYNRKQHWPFLHVHCQCEIPSWKHKISKFSRQIVMTSAEHSSVSQRMNPFFFSFSTTLKLNWQIDKQDTVYYVQDNLHSVI